jgi:hypothetical protein
MQDFAYCLGGDVRMSKVELSQQRIVRAYAQASDRRVGVYLQRKLDQLPAAAVYVGLCALLQVVGVRHCQHSLSASRLPHRRGGGYRKDG